MAWTRLTTLRPSTLLYPMHSYIIPEHELEEKFTRSGGPGGQNVNKVATAVQLRFHIPSSQTLPWAVQQRLSLLAKNRIDKHGTLLIRASRYRTLELNRRDARERLQALVDQCANPPKKRKKRRGESRGAKERRIRSKRRRSDVKKGRSKPNLDS